MSLAVTVAGFGRQFRRFEEAGISFEAGLTRDRLLLGRDPGVVLGTESFQKEDDFLLQGGETPQWLDEEDAAFLQYLVGLDPGDFTHQDHYKVLGLSTLRWKASETQIRLAYRQKVLRHHPDKRVQAGVQRRVLTDGEDYFSCITRAYEQLGVSLQKRRAFDSVDPAFDESVPTGNVTAGNFFATFAPVFQRNARFSTISPVPELGTETSSREEVDQFYSFWFAFSSWREFSYLDEEDKGKGEDRYERREIDKANKLERERRRKKEARRIRGLVEMAYGTDPRIAAFKLDEKKQKEKEKREREEALRHKREEELRIQEELEIEKRRIAEEDARLEREKRELARKARDNARKARAQHRKSIMAIAERADFWADSSETRLACNEKLERVCLALDLDELAQFETRLALLQTREEAIDLIQHQLEKLTVVVASDDASKTKPARGGENKENGHVMWTSEEMHLLTKAVNLFPAGVKDRWTAMLEYIKDHRKTGTPKTEKDVIRQVKGLAAVESRPETTKQHALAVGALGDDWTVDEQRLLEHALRSIPASVGADRWSRIADLVATKSPQQCASRFKKLSALVKQRKQQTPQAAINE